MSFASSSPVWPAASQSEMSPPFGKLRPMLRQLEPPHALGDAERCLAGRIGVRIAGRVMIGDNHDVGAAKAFAVGHAPFRRLPSSLAPSGLQVARMPMRHRLSASFSPSTTGALAWRSPRAPRATDRVALWTPCVLLIQPLLPSGRRSQKRCASWRVADFLEQKYAGGVDVDIGRASPSPPRPRR